MLPGVAGRAILGMACCVLLAQADATPAFETRQPPAWTIVDAQVADGNGGPLRRANVRLEGDTIREVGAVVPHTGDRVLNAAGLVLAPGFIDIHNHSTDGLDTEPDAATQVSQGITTVVLGQDGGSPFPVRDYLARRGAFPAAVNVAVMAGHGTIRREVMRDDFRRTATAAEVARMQALVDQEMAGGAAGLSSGLEYEIGSYASTDEVVALAQAAAKHGGFYISHIRDEADRTLEAVREAIAIGERARIPVQITHIKLGTVGVWGKADEVVAIVDAARKKGIDVTADAYPYLAWSSNLKILVPNKQWSDPSSVKEALDDVGGGRNIQIARLPMFPQYAGKRLSEVAAAEGISEVEAYIRIVKDDGASVIGHTMSEPDMKVFYRQPWTMVASDGGVNVSHPRGAGTFPRVLGRFVREEGWLTLPEAIRKMTSLPASRLGLKDRGRIASGMKADLVLFDPATVLDLSTFDEPQLRARGIHTVFVNGLPVWRDGKPDGHRPGVVLARGAQEGTRTRTFREVLAAAPDIDLAGFNDQLLNAPIPPPKPGRRYVLAPVHINPSAERLLVLTESRLVGHLYGWELAILPDETIVYHKNQVHFAPTHGLEIAVFDPETRVDRQIYPPAAVSGVRRTFIARVAKAYKARGEDWFRENNHHMDPTQFDSTLLDSVVVDERTGAMTFRVRFGDPESGRDPLPFSTIVRVTCAPLAPVSRIQCRETADK